jgi:hypothetical protein
MYIEMALLAVILGLVLGGSLKKLIDLKIRWISLLLVSVFASLLPQIPWLGVTLAGFGTTAAFMVAVLRYGFLLAFAVLNYRYIPVCVIGAGGLSNFIVTLANGGRMPVSPEALVVGAKDAGVALVKGGFILNYKVADAGTRLRPLCDIIQARGIYIYFLSVGDILISIGIFALIIQLMEPKLLTRALARIHTKPPVKRR